jgi:CrcB protein
MIRLTALVAIGGAAGSVARFWVALAVGRLTGPAFPWGTILINIVGSFVIGWLAAVFAQRPAASWQAFTMVGICGGFTTFSAFSLQTFDLLRAGRAPEALANVAVSVLLCVAATAAGAALGR